MKPINCLLVAAAFGSSWFVGPAFAQSITLEMGDNYLQTGDGTLTQTGSPYEFQAIIRHGNSGLVSDFNQWGPVLKLPGGSSSAPNFTASPNTGNGDYLMFENFTTAEDLFAAFPTGSYSIGFGGSSAPTPSVFSAGLDFSGGAFALAPSVTGVNNGAVWSNGLRIRNHSITTLTLSDFSEYAAAAYDGTGTIITVGIRDALGNVVSEASRLSYYVPGAGYTQDAIDQLELDATWLTPGVDYTLQIQYGILGSAPASGLLNGETFDGLALYYTSTSMNLTAIPEPATMAALAGLFTLGLVTWRRHVSRRRACA